MSKVKIKAGMIPFIVKDGEIKMLFQVSSDPDFGGPDPMISKGGVDEGETIYVTAVREASEELGLEWENIKTLEHWWTSKMYGYELNIFVSEVKDPEALIDPHYETKEVQWLTVKEFEQVGRKDHLFIVKYFDKKIRENL